MENYLFKDYRWKSGIPVWNLILPTSGRKRVDRGAEMVQKHKLPNDIFPCKDCVLIAQGKYANSKTRVNNSSVKAS